ncbi:hypothetical protein F4777DRAFT_551401 [Nemania sp. FL0916]|nr:hypothetical protein F4777DRAFT_551401 [Nemania sp. FL0916]
MASTTPLPSASSVTSAPTSSTTPICANLYEIPISSPGCAVSFSGPGHKDAMTSCCKSAEVIAYFSDCGLYCAATGQSVKDLQDCLFGKHVAYQDVFCNAAVNATASDGSPELPETASASVVAGGSGTGKGDGGATATGEDGGKPSDTDSAAPRNVPELAVSKVGLMIGGLLFSAMAFGAFQI